jgi:hypothetical protein
MSLFINKCLLKEERIISNKITKNKPRYIICDCFGDKLGTSSRTFEEVKYYFELGYKPNDIFILAPSIKSGNSPIRQLENKIKREMPNVMVYVPTNDDEKLDEELLEGKIIFSTFHQTKGLERKVVIIFNFDNSYFEFYKKDANPCICSNELYVATTRGIEHLTLFHHYQKEYLHFIDKSNIQLYCHFEDTKMFINPKTNLLRNINTSITDIIKFLPQNIIDECFNKLEITKNSKYIINKINIPLKIKNDETTECVSEITGIAIPSMFELKLKNKISIYELLIKDDFEKNVINHGNNECLFHLHNKSKQKKYNINDINIQNLTSEELLYLSNCWNTHKNGYLFKIYQITNYDWLEEKKLNECINRLTELNISKNSLFEYGLNIENETELLNRQLIGFIDCIDKDKNIVYEFKCVQKLEKEHYLQLALYMYMYELEKIKHIKRITDEFNKNKDKLVNEIKNITHITDEFDKIKDKLVNDINEIKKSIFDLLYMKEQIIEKISINDNLLMYYKNNMVYKKINDIENDSYNLNNYLNDVNNLIDENNVKLIKLTNKLENENIIKLTTKLEDENNKKIIKLTNNLEEEIELYNKKTKYVLFNILTNEYINIECEFQKLKKIVEYLIYSKYINDKPITNEDFIKLNKNIYKLYFS